MAPAKKAPRTSIEAAKLAAKNAAKTSTLGARVPKLDTLKSWSYSVYGQYLKCPLSVCFEKIKRIKIAEPPNPAFEKGNRMHEFAASYVVGKGKPPVVIPEMSAVEGHLTKFRKMKTVFAERDWSFTRQWLPTTWNDWANCWLRIKVDVCAVEDAPAPLIHITDWKSGKIYPEHAQQRSLYALGGLQLLDLGVLAPDLPKAEVKLVAEHLYTDTTQSATEEYTLKDLKPLKAEWERRVKRMMSDTEYRPRTGFHCRHCKFRKSNGGPCPENQ